MIFYSFQNNYHDSHIESFQLGPGEELALDIHLDPVWNKGGAISSRIRFGGIKNYEEVCGFFKNISVPSDERFIDEIVGIKKTAKLSWVVDLGRMGALVIQCTQFDEL